MSNWKSFFKNQILLCVDGQKINRNIIEMAILCLVGNKLCTKHYVYLYNPAQNKVALEGRIKESSAQIRDVTMCMYELSCSEVD